MTNIIRIFAGPYFTQKIEILSMDDELNLHTLQDLIGADCIEVVNPIFLQTLYDETACMIVDESGMLKGREINQLCGHLYGANIYGPALIVKRDEEDLVGLDNAEELKEKLEKALGRQMKREETIDKLMRSLGCESLSDDGKNKEREEKTPEVRHVNKEDVLNDMALILATTSAIYLTGQLVLETEKSEKFQQIGANVSEGMVVVGSIKGDIAEKLFGEHVRGEVVKRGKDLSATFNDIAKKEWPAEKEEVKANDLN